MRSGTIGIGVGDYTITIGAGGVYGDRNPGTEDARGAANGNPSSIVGTGIDLSTDGGGGGGSFLGPNIEFEASPGGSGGGTHGETAGSNIVGYGNNPTPYNLSQGYPGGKKSAPFNPNYIGRQGGGGGGAGGAGGDSRKQVIYYFPNQPIIQGCGGDGGTGRAFGVIQEDTFALPDAYGGEFGPDNKLYFAGGGGGGGGFISGSPYSSPIGKLPTIIQNHHGGSAGLGEGGRGGRYTPNTSNDRFGGFGGANSGGGGGGGAGGNRPSGYFDNRGGSGGSGIIIISYKETI